MNKITKLKAPLMGLTVLAMSGLTTVAMADVNLGVMASRGAVAAMSEWGPVGEYFSQKVGETVKIVPVLPENAETAMANKEVDFLIANPVVAVSLKEKQGASPLASVKGPDGSKFAGVIISKAGSGINKAEDLKGKKVMAFQFRKSAAAYVFQVKHVMDKGVNPERDFASFIEGKKQDDIVLAVKAGVVDAGFVKSGLLESMAKEGKVAMSDFVVVDQRKDELAQVHSTILYPDWYLVGGKGANSGMASKLKSAAIGLDGSSEAAKTAKIAGFEEPLSLKETADSLRALHLPPYDK